MADMGRNEYEREVERLAESITAEVWDYLDPDDRDEGGGVFLDALNERLWETIDGHQWVIYTAYNYDVMRFSDNDGYSAENFGVDSIVKDGVLNTAAIAFGALYADVQEHSAFGVVPESVDA